MERRVPLPVGLLALCTPLLAQTPQELVDAASPGSWIDLSGGTWPPLTIDKPLNIVSWPAARFEARPEYGDAAPIRLRGPGTGKVVLFNIDTGGYIPYTVGRSEGGIAGGGFASLELWSCSVNAPEQRFVEGLGLGAPGMSVTIPDLLIVESTVTASENVDDACAGEKPGAAGILAPGSSVTLVSSSVRGSSHRFPCDYPHGEECPDWLSHGNIGVPGVGPYPFPRTSVFGDPLPPLAGPGVRASSLSLFDGSSVLGGPAPRWVWLDPLSGWHLCAGRSWPGLSFIEDP